LDAGYHFMICGVLGFVLMEETERYRRRKVAPEGFWFVFSFNKKDIKE
jgi:hypothetical protein